jgi:hypothetical protein
MTMQSADIRAALYAAMTAFDGDGHITADMIKHAQDRYNSDGSTAEIMDLAGMFTTFAERIVSAAKAKS